ncbi:MAG: DedA family protein [Bacteroidales bacterium]|jgi:membrane protein DedA with SNARE-associated domain|nr:DedA family protein [Bacteroidales bacterium]
MMNLLQTLLDWYMANLNYSTVMFLMTVESTFIPFPSEAVVPFAAYKAAQGDLNIFLVVLFATIGALLGSLINYLLGYYLGRPLVHKFAASGAGRLFLLSEEKIVHVEQYFVKNGKSSTFIGRLIPGIRQLISLPAGMAKMNLRDFVLFTFVGAGLWNICLAVIGYYLYDIREEIFPYIGWIMIALGVVFVIYLIIKAQKSKKQ